MAVIRYQEGVPVPPPAPRRPGRPPAYDFTRLQVGHSLVMESEDPVEHRKLYQAMRQWNRRQAPKRLEWRRVEKGVGVWRIR